MAVAAAGGFYFVYQGFTESGEESGSTQIEQLGEQSLAAIQIESAAGGRIYVKNVGASDIDLSKVSVYVENVPYSVNTSSDTLAERNRAVLKFTQRPSCSSDSCEVKISGAVSASKSVDISKLSCSSDAECYSSETCEGGVCVEGEGETAVCGDGECAASEHGYDCWEDCHPESVALPSVEVASSSLWLTQYDWNGTTYDFAGNVTEAIDMVIRLEFQPLFLPNGNHIAAGTANSQDHFYSYWLSKYDGSSWSYPSNLSNQYELYTGSGFPSPDSDSAGNAMFVWAYEEPGQPVPNEKVQWVTLQDGVVSDPDNVTNWLDTGSGPSFAFAPDNSGFALYKNVSDFATHNNHKILYSHWDGSSWDDTGVVANYPNVASANSISFFYPRVSFADNGDAMSVWGVRNKTNYVYYKYAVHEGSAWSSPANFEGWTPVNYSDPDLPPVGLAYDHQDKFVFATSSMASSFEDIQDFFFTYDGIWSANQTFPEASGKWLSSISKTPDNTLFAIEMDYGAVMAGERDIWRWTVWNGDGWSDPIYVGPWEAA